MWTSGRPPLSSMCWLVVSEQRSTHWWQWMGQDPYRTSHILNVCSLFATIYAYCDPSAWSDPLKFWLDHKGSISEHYACTHDQHTAENLALADIHDITTTLEVWNDLYTTRFTWSWNKHSTWCSSSWTTCTEHHTFELLNMLVTPEILCSRSLVTSRENENLR